MTGPWAEFARVKASGMRAACIKLAKEVETTTSKSVFRSHTCRFACATADCEEGKPSEGKM